MDIPTMKLYDIHKGSGSPSLCSILWDAWGKNLVTSSSADPAISICNASELFWEPARKQLCSHTDGVTALVLSPDFAFLAFCSIDHSVHLCSFPGGIFFRVFTRLGSRSRCLAFNSSGSLLAAAGDDGRIRLMDTVNGTMFLVLKDDDRGPVSAPSFDPVNYYLASADVLGTVAIWWLPSGRQLHRLRALAPSRADASLTNVLSWSADGNLLAVSGSNNDVVVLNGADDFQKMYTLEGDTGGGACAFISWSSDRMYLATSWLDKQVLLWDVDKRQVVGRRRFQDVVCSLAWKPHGNAVAVIDVRDKVGVWEPAVPWRVPNSSPAVSLPPSKKDTFVEDTDVELSPYSPGDGGPLSSDASSGLCTRRDLSCDDELDATDRGMEHEGVRFGYHGPGFRSPQVSVRRGGGHNKLSRRGLVTFFFFFAVSFQGYIKRSLKLVFVA